MRRHSDNPELEGMLKSAIFVVPFASIAALVGAGWVLYFLYRVAVHVRAWPF